MTTITLRDLDNRDDAGTPFEFTGTQQKVASYLDGPVRRDLIETAIPELDTAIAHIHAAELAQAASILRRFAITLAVDGTRLERKCRGCGCTDNDCSNCIERTGRACSWVAGEPDLCTACGDR
jgi:hypothetical protein